jgi:hypothetical protein
MSRKARVDLLHRNIRKYGTITNTLASACVLTGEILARPAHVHVVPIQVDGV